MIDAKVQQVRAVARDVLLVEIQSADGQPLPGAAGGAHIDLHLPNGLVRQYSLTNATGQARMDRYEVAVGLDANSRGGSRWIHERLKPGTALRVGGPRNLFALDPAHRKVLLLGGGIGITPLVAMARSAAQQGLDWQLVACARSIGRIALAEELLALGKDRVRLHGDLEAGHPLDLAALLQAQDWDGVYACGPQGMLNALEGLTAGWPEGRYRSEQFKADPIDTSGDRPFELVLADSQLSTEVQPGESVLDAMERLGVAHPYACREGLCGTCEVGLCDGQPDHRDSVLDPSQRATRFIPCVSRCGGGTLTLQA